MAVLLGGMGWRSPGAQPSPRARHGIPCLVTQYLAGDSLAAPLRFGPVHSEHRPGRRAHVFHLKAPRAAEASGPPSASSQQLRQRVSPRPGPSVFSLTRIPYGWPRTPRESAFSHYLEVAAIVCLSSSAAQNGFLPLPASAVLCAFNGLETTHRRKPFRSAALLQSSA